MSNDSCLCCIEQSLENMTDLIGDQFCSVCVMWMTVANYFYTNFCIFNPILEYSFFKHTHSYRSEKENAKHANLTKSRLGHISFLRSKGKNYRHTATVKHRVHRAEQKAFIRSQSTRVEAHPNSKA